MGINGKPLLISTQLLDATLVFRLQFFLLIPIFVYPGESCVILVHVQNKLFFYPQVVQHPVEAPYLHYEEGCHGVIVPCGFGGHRVLWGYKWYVTRETTFFSITFGYLSLTAQSQNIVPV